MMFPDSDSFTKSKVSFSFCPEFLMSLPPFQVLPFSLHELHVWMLLHILLVERQANVSHVRPTFYTSTLVWKKCATNNSLMCFHNPDGAPNTILIISIQKENSAQAHRNHREQRCQGLVSNNMGRGGPGRSNSSQSPVAGSVPKGSLREKVVTTWGSNFSHGRIERTVEVNCFLIS